MDTLPPISPPSRKDRLVALLPFMEIRSWLTGTRGVSLPFTDECAPILPDGMPFDEAAREVISRARSRRWRTDRVSRTRPRHGEPPRIGGIPDPRTRPDARGRDRFFPIPPERSAEHPEGGEGGDLGGARSDAGRSAGVLPAELPHPAGARPAAAAGPVFREPPGARPGKGFGTLLLARHEGRAVAGAVFLHFAGKAIYKYGASDRRYQELRPNNLVFREGIRDLCGKGVRTLSFGRTDLHHEGLRQFKLSWGAMEKTLQYVKYDVTSKSYLSAKKYRATIPWESTMSKLPIPVLRLIGHIAYRHVG